MLSNPTENLAVNGSVSTPPNTNWSPQQQTARMLALCEAQMEAATQDSDMAVDMLIHSFSDLMTLVRELSAESNNNHTDTQTIKFASEEEMKQRYQQLLRQVNNAIMAFQFYDKLSQRLGHVRYSLSTLALFVCDRMNSQKPEHWEKLVSTLGRLYRTAEERAIFDNIAGSLAINANGEKPKPLSQGASPEGSIELF
jgi:hypothetical protein